MLGLANCISAGAACYNEVLSYASDFTSGVNGWQAYSVEDSASDLTLTGNTDGFSGEDNWLKGEYGVTQTNLSGIELSSYGTILAGDFTTITFKIHLSEDWDGSDAVYTRYYVGAETSSFTPAQDTTETLSDTLYHAAGSTVLPKIVFSAPGDLPQNGAIFHIKDIVIKTYRLNG